MKLFKKAYYEKLMMQNPKTVNDYYLIIANAQDKIKELQAKCEHKEFRVGFYSYRPGSLVPSRICTTCSHLIGNATDEESEALRNKYGFNQLTSPSFTGIVSNVDIEKKEK